MPSIDKYAVMGNPVEHSLSPIMHQLFAKQTQQIMTYEKILVPVGHFVAAVNDFFQQGGKGLNITVPFKQEAWQLVHQRSEAAEIAGAVNTIYKLADGTIYGDNTDGIGLVNDLIEKNKIELMNKDILILGAGGAARGIIAPLLAKSPRKVTIVNRTVSKAEGLVQELKELGNLTYHSYVELTGMYFDLIINATSLSLNNAVPPLPDNMNLKNTVCYDMVYNQQTTSFLHWAKQHGAINCINGIGMLVCQGAQAFYLWRNVYPKVRPVIQHLQKLLQNK